MTGVKRLTKTCIVLLNVSRQAFAGGCLCGALGILGASQALADWELLVTARTGVSSKTLAASIPLWPTAAHAMHTVAH